MDELPYIAGLFDGEGSIFVASRSSSHNTLQLRVSISMVQEEGIVLVSTMFGGGVNCYEKTGNRRRQWHWSLSGTGAKDFLRILRPWLRVKAEEADAALDYPVGPRGTWLNEEERERQQVIATELKRLKRA